MKDITRMTAKGESKQIPKLYIRTDVNQVLGIGHWMRCRTIADEWIRRGGESVFLVADKVSAEIIENMGFQVICLNGAWNNLDVEKETLLQIIKQQNIECIFIDSYYITQDYMKMVADHVKVIYLGMMYEQARSVHMLINYSVTADKAAYEAKYSLDAIKLFGCKYFPLRPEFVGVDITIKNKVNDIFISTGGSDPYHVALVLANLFLTHTEKNIHIIVGMYNEDKEELKRLQDENSHLHIYEDVQNMAGIMSQCDVAVSAGGITLYELSACGIPAVTYVFADNQLSAVDTFAKKGIVLSAGDIRHQTEKQWGQRIYDQIEILCNDFKLRKGMAYKMKQLIDGKGTDRIVDRISMLY